MKHLAYVVVVEKTATGYSAYVPDLPGCVAASRTRPGVVKLISQAIELHLEDMQERGQRIPRPSTSSHTVTLKTA